ncbi:MAG: prepilin peptidase [Myxococcaceae bacterium]
MTLAVVTNVLWVVTICVAVITDLKRRSIHDVLTWPAMALLLGARAWFEGVGDERLGVLSGLLGLAISGGWFSVFALRKSIGWGDVKLAAAMGAAFGFPRVFVALVFVSLAGAFQAVFSLIWQGKLSATVRGVLPKQHIPYGVAIALGSVGAMVWDGNGF